MIRFTLSVGSNDGDRVNNVSKAIEWIRDRFAYVAYSSVYETPEIHGVGKPYMNAVAEAASASSLEEVNALLKAYEKSHGRDDDARAEGRVPVDIDIVIWNGVVIRPFDYAAEFFRIGHRQIGNES